MVKLYKYSALMRAWVFVVYGYRYQAELYASLGFVVIYT